MNWLNKPALIINEMMDIMLRDDETFRNHNPIRAMMDNPNLFPLVSEENKYLTDDFVVIVASKLNPTLYGINKAYNSRKYPQLSVVANNLLNEVTINRRNELIYTDASAVPLEDYQNWFSQINHSGLELNPSSFIEQAYQKTLEIIVKAYNALKAKIEALKEKATATMKWALWELEKIKNAAIQGLKENPLTKSVPGIIPITVGGVVDKIGAIASMILKFLSAGQVAQGVIEALKWTVTSIVAKYLGGTMIAEACRYLAADVLRILKDLLPAVFNPTGLFAGAWTFLMAYAPLIISAAILTILIIKRHQRTIGEYLYVIGMNNDKVRAYGFAKLYDTNYEEMKKVLLDMGEEIRLSARTNLTQFMGFALEDDKTDKVALAINFFNNNQVIEGDQGNTLVIPFIPTITDYGWWK